MHGRGGEDRKRRLHMWSDHAPATAATTAESAVPFPVPPPVSATINSDYISPDFFLKDGRKFRVGDCALFQAGGSPPFIGIICWFTPVKETYVKLGVTWLYRPSDIKLAKGVLLEAAPNEVFYSFHKDAISAESLLHPCKVAFLRKGIELPSGISSFVCWRVYDITNKRLWWLTDTDYITERQEEVDQLLDKTRLEMHAAVQSGGHSPKPLSGHLSAQQLKSSSDSIQSSNTSLPSQAKVKKRGERSDQGSELMKRERTSKADDVDSGIFRLDSIIKAEIAKITDRGGLSNNDAVEKLVQLMQLDKVEKKIDLAGRVLLADVIAATDRNDCLVRFVQLRGVPMLDDWLQEAHKGKNGDGNSVTEGVKSVEDLLLSLLRALDKLPVNLNALQTCHIGKSVNNLRSHKNIEIQKKARSLVDTWKKRVDAEMTKIEMAKLNDAKSIASSQTISWTGKSGLSEVPVGGNKRVTSNDLAIKSSTNPPSTFKSLPIKNGQGDSIAKSNLATAGSVKLPSTLRLGAGNGTAELPVPIAKDEKSSSFSQLQNNNQPCPSDHTKAAGFSWKEDVKSTAAGSTNTSKISGGTSRQRRSLNGLVGTGAAGVQKDNGIGRSNSLFRSTTPEKIGQSGLSVERTHDVPVADHGNNHRLIVRLPNPGRSPARSASGGSLDDLSVTGSRASSPGVLEKNDHIDKKMKVKNDICQVKSAIDVNSESCQIIDRQGVVGSGHAIKSPVALLDEEHTKNTDDSGKVMNSLNTGVLFEPNPGKPFEASPNLIGVSVQHEGDSESLPNDSTERLRPTLNADTMSKSELSPSSGSPRKSPATENPSALSDIRSKVSSDDIVTQVPGEPEDNNAKTDCEKFESSANLLLVQDDVKQNSPDLKAMSLGHGKCFVPPEETESTGDHRDQYHVSAAASGKNSALILTLENKLNNVVADGNVPSSNIPGEIKDGISEGNSAELISDGLPNCQQMDANRSGENRSLDYVYENNPEGNVLLTDENEFDHNNIRGIKCEKESVEKPSCSPVDKQKVVDEGLHVGISIQPVSSVMEACSDDIARNVDNGTATSVSVHPCLEAVDEPKKEKFDNMAMKGQLEPSDDEKDHAGPAETPFDRVCCSLIAISHGIKEDSEKKVIKHQPLESVSHGETPAMPAIKTEQCAQTLDSKLCCGGAGEAAEAAFPQDTSSGVISHQSDPSTKLGFDLNEGFSVDDGNIAEPVTPCVPGCSPAVYSSNMTPFTVSPISNSLPSHITVASPAKGPFLPSEILLKSKGEGGWKGSAATSAFRRAEPRKVADVSIGSPDAVPGKQFHLPLNIDLNVPDETVLEDIASQCSAQQIDTKSVVLGNHNAPIRSSGGLDLDLNKVDESTESGQLSTSTSQRLEVSLWSVRPTSRGFPDGEANSLRDFDLNNGPGIEGGMEQLSRGRHTKGCSVPFLPSLRMNGNETGILTSWFPPGNSYSAVAIPSFLPDRGDQPYSVVAAPSSQMVLGSAVGGGGAFGNDLYRGSVLSSSPTVTFPPSAAFSYAGFPFGSSFPLASTSFSGGPTTFIDPVSGGPCFPAIPTPLMGRSGAASSPYVRPNIISLPEGSTSSGAESNRKWGWQSLDLNAGPGSVDVEGREDRSSLASRQLSATSSQGFSGEQARTYQTAGGGGLKRKEPGGGWDMDRIPYKQHPWQ